MGLSHADGGAGPLDAGRKSDMPFSEGGVVLGLAKERRASRKKLLVDGLIDLVVAAGGLGGVDRTPRRWWHCITSQQLARCHGGVTSPCFRRLASEH